jgi:hypothetical protein
MHLSHRGALYVRSLLLPDGVTEIDQITGNGLNIYYDPASTDNAYVGDATYSLSGGGFILPVPEPGSTRLLIIAITVGGFLRRRGATRIRP